MSHPLVVDDLPEMSILGSFMFLLNEMRDLYRGGREPKENAEKYTPEVIKKLFAPIMTFPMTAATIQSVVIKAKDVLVPLQGENRYQAHLDMLDMMTKDNEDAETSTSPIFLNYSDDNDVVGHELVYSIVLDHAKRRVTVVFRGSVTGNDWAANLDVKQIKVDNPTENGSPPEILMHRGFYEYVFEPIRPDSDGDVESEQPEGGKTTFDVILAKVQDVLKDHPTYDVYTTGVSLGGALTIVFCFFAAAHPSLNRPGHPIKCYSFASPKVGAISFRKAFQDLEASGRVMLCRVANDDDPVVPLPRRCCAIYPMCGLEYVVMCCLCCLQFTIYRHVGMGLKLPPDRHRHAQYVHTKIQSNWIRTLCSDWGKLVGRSIILPLHFLCMIVTCTNPAGYRENHGYPEYWSRVNDQLPYLKSLKDEDGNAVTLEELYCEFLHDDRTIVKTRFM